MNNPNASFFSPDKIIKDLQWECLSSAVKYSKGELLDVGCGRMPYKSLFLHKVKTYTGIDKYSPIADIKKDFYTAKILKGSYDTVLCTQVLEHVPDPQTFLKKINSVLKKNGILILTVPFSGYLHEVPRDYYRYTKFALAYMMKKTNFKIIYIKQEGNWLSSMGLELISYLEPTFNRFLLKYPKRFIQLLILLFIKATLHWPERLAKSEYSTINYIVLAKKA